MNNEGIWVGDEWCHAHSLEDFIAGRLVPHQRCTHCPPAGGPRLKVTAVDPVTKTLTFTSAPTEGS